MRARMSGLVLRQAVIVYRRAVCSGRRLGVPFFFAMVLTDALPVSMLRYP